MQQNINVMENTFATTVNEFVINQLIKLIMLWTIVICYICPESAKVKIVKFLLNPCHAEKIKISCPLLIISQSDCLIYVVDKNSDIDWQIVRIQISWLIKKQTDRDLHCLQSWGILEFSGTRINNQQIFHILVKE